MLTTLLACLVLTACSAGQTAKAARKSKAGARSMAELKSPSASADMAGESAKAEDDALFEAAPTVVKRSYDHLRPARVLAGFTFHEEDKNNSFIRFYRDSNRVDLNFKGRHQRGRLLSLGNALPHSQRGTYHVEAWSGSPARPLSEGPGSQNSNHYFIEWAFQPRLTGSKDGLVARVSVEEQSDTGASRRVLYHFTFEKK